MTLRAYVYDSPDRNRLLHTLAGGFTFSTNKHGFRDWQAECDVSFEQAQAIYNWTGVPHVEVVDDSDFLHWQGRLEDIAIRGGSVSLGAFGYWRALTDVPYTALWSKTGSGDWRALLEDEVAVAAPGRYEMDNNNRVYIAQRKNEESDNTHWGAMVYLLPDGGEREASTIAFDYSLEASGGLTYVARVRSYDDSWTQIDDNKIAASAGSTSGSYSFSFSAGVTRIAILFLRARATPHAHADETGENGFFKATNIRIKTTTAASVLASDIAAALATYVNGINSSQLQASSALIEATTTDLQDELYEDELPADILDRLALLHGYEAGVWTGQRLHFREKGSAGRTWYVKAHGVLEAQRSFDRVANSAYAVYRDANNRALRTAVSGDAGSQNHFGVIRRDFVDVRTTASAEAETHRNAILADRAKQLPRISLEIERLEDEGGGAWPLYYVRAGDTIIFRDLLPFALSANDGMGSFIVGETEYGAGQLQLASEEPLPTLVTLVARKEAGLR